MGASVKSAIKEKLRGLPESPGIYVMKDRLGRVIYVGKAKILKRRVSSYFQKGRARDAHPKLRALVGLIEDFEVFVVKNEAEALLLEGKLIKQWRPKYNTDFTDDKRFLLVRVTMGEELPRFRLTRFRNDEASRYFGPFAKSGFLRKTLALVRRKFGVLLGDAKPLRMEDGRWRLYEGVGEEIYGVYGGKNEVSVEEYRARVEEACEFLEGTSRESLAELKEGMKKAAERREFEKAAELRDVAEALAETLRKTRSFGRFDIGKVGAELKAGAAREGLLKLKEVLGLVEVPEVMECFDISHLSGTLGVASMVQFAGGVPAKGNYRRFKIKSFAGNDDFRAMEEVVWRRYRRLSEEGVKLPDLVVIDGGIGQVGSALRAFAGLGVELPVIGLAKKRETIVFPDGRELNLEMGDAGLRVLQQLRDEAHRFANTFNAELRTRKLRESVLDDFEGIGSVKRKALMEKFGSVERLRKAGVEELVEVPGIGARLAGELKVFLEKAGRLGSVEQGGRRIG